MAQTTVFVVYYPAEDKLSVLPFQKFVDVEQVEDLKVGTTYETVWKANLPTVRATVVKICKKTTAKATESTIKQDHQMNAKLMKIGRDVRDKEQVPAPDNPVPEQVPPVVLAAEAPQVIVNIPPPTAPVAQAFVPPPANHVPDLVAQDQLFHHQQQHQHFGNVQHQQQQFFQPHHGQNGYDGAYFQQYEPYYQHHPPPPPPPVQQPAPAFNMPAQASGLNPDIKAVLDAMKDAQVQQMKVISDQIAAMQKAPRKKKKSEAKIKWSILMDSVARRKKWTAFHTEAANRLFAGEKKSTMRKKVVEWPESLQKKRRLLEEKTLEFANSYWLKNGVGRTVPSISKVRKSFNDWHSRQQKRNRDAAEAGNNESSSSSSSDSDSSDSDE